MSALHGGATGLSTDSGCAVACTENEAHKPTRMAPVNCRRVWWVPAALQCIATPHCSRCRWSIPARGKPSDNAVLTLISPGCSQHTFITLGLLLMMAYYCNNTLSRHTTSCVDHDTSSNTWFRCAIHSINDRLESQGCCTPLSSGCTTASQAQASVLATWSRLLPTLPAKGGASPARDQCAASIGVSKALLLPPNAHTQPTT